MFLDGAKLHQPGRILLPVSSSRTGRPIARSAEELSSTWPSPADITVDLDHRPNWTERIVELRLRPTVGDLSLHPYPLMVSVQYLSLLSTRRLYGADR